MCKVNHGWENLTFKDVLKEAASLQEAVREKNAGLVIANKIRPAVLYASLKPTAR
jgi:hypothetical protein